MSTVIATSTNQLLAHMAPEDSEALFPHLERVVLDLRYVIEEAHKPIEYAYFPETAIGSIVAQTKRGNKIEAGLFGRDGMSALAVVLGGDESPNVTVIQIAGVSVRMPIARLREVMTGSQSLRAFLLAYAFSMAIQTAHTALSNGRQTLSGRLARWLLMCQDRVDGNLMLTHEHMSIMLGVRRPGVTLAIRELEGQGLIHTSRSTITVIDRDGLIASAEGFYGIPEEEYRRLVMGERPEKQPQRTLGQSALAAP